mgnify:CR=1 FL=1
MTYEELLKNQSEVIKLLNNAKRKNKLTHAYLFEGDSGTGTLEAARYFAMMLLCDQEQPCLTCNTCERIQYNSHLNVVLIEQIFHLFHTLTFHQHFYHQMLQNTNIALIHLH